MTETTDGAQAPISTSALPVVSHAGGSCDHPPHPAGGCSTHPAPAACDAASPAAAADPNEIVSEASRETRLLEALKTVIDPELMVNIVDLGLVYAVEQAGSRVSIEMTLTSPACPAGPQIIQQARMALERLHDVDEVEIRLVMSPPWSPERMTDEARDMLGIF